jgi:hypothetical protein
MDNQQAIDDALNKLEIKNEVVVGDETIIVEPEVVLDADGKVVVEPIVDPIVEPEVKVNPPGYIDNVEDWVAAGKDPKLFKSPELYSAEYERIKEIKDLKETMQTVVDGVSEWKEAQTRSMDLQLQQAKDAAANDLAVAKEDDDVDAAIKAQKKISELDTPQQPAVYQPNPVITKFYSNNLILDKNNSQYDPEVFQDTAMFQKAILDKLTGGDQTIQLTPSQIERSLVLALKDAKALSPDKFVSPRNTRKSAPVTPRTKVQQNEDDYSARLKSVKSNTMNRHDTSAGIDVYNMLKAKADAIVDPAKKAKALKSVETYARTVLGD